MNVKKDLNAKLKEKILQLKKQKKAVIIAHNYQVDDVQEIADVTGDSLALSKAAISFKEDIIVFCGVIFMAENASILNPDKTILLPVKEAGCPLADMITAQELRVLKEKNKSAVVVCYVNSSADVKAESDICCTSANAVEVVKSVSEKKIIFVPDKNLGRYVQSQVPEKEFVFWDGFCNTHAALTVESVQSVMKKYPNAQFIAHPECRMDVLQLADKTLSTGGMLTYVKNSKCSQFIIGTERGLLYKLKKENPNKKFILPSEDLICNNMKLTTLEWVLHSLEKMEYKVKVPSVIQKKAYKALVRMLDISGEKKWQAVAGN